MTKFTTLLAALVISPICMMAETATFDCSTIVLNSNTYDIGNGYFISSSVATLTVEQGNGSQRPQFADGKLTVYGGNFISYSGTQRQLIEVIGEATGWDSTTAFSLRNGDDMETALVDGTMYFRTSSASASINAYMPDDDGSNSHFTFTSIRFTDIYTDPLPTEGGTVDPGENPGTEEPSADAYYDENADKNLDISTLKANIDYYEYSPSIFIISGNYSITLNQGAGISAPTISDGTLYLYAQNTVQITTSGTTGVQKVRFAGMTDWTEGTEATLYEAGTATIGSDGLNIITDVQGNAINTVMPSTGGSVIKVKMINLYETADVEAGGGSGGEIETPEEDDEPTTVIIVADNSSNIITTGDAIYFFVSNDTFYFDKGNGTTKPVYNSSNGTITVYAGNRVGIQAQRARQRYKFMGKLKNWDSTCTFATMSSSSARFEGGSMIVDGDEPLQTYNAYMPDDNGGTSSLEISSIRVYESIDNGDSSGLKEVGSQAIAVNGNNIQLPAGGKIYNMRGEKIAGNNLPAGVYVVSTSSGTVKVAVK